MKRYTLNITEKAFSDKTAELLNQGYQVLPCAMSGHQGEVAKITFTKDNRYFVLFLTSRQWGFKTMPHCDLIFAEAPADYVPGHGMGNTLWIDHSTPIETITFYELGESYSNHWTTDKEFAEACRQKSRDRHQAKRVTTSTEHHDTDEWKKAAWKVLKKTPGYKTTALKDVMCVYLSWWGEKTELVIEVAHKPTMRRTLAK